jgi:hypothetical protein
MRTSTDKNMSNQQPPAMYAQIDPETGLIESEFLIAFRARFIGSGPNPNWPASQSQAGALAIAQKEIPEVLSAMFAKVENGDPLPGGPAGSGLALLSEVATATGWPGPDSEVPAGWEDHPAIFRRYEISGAMNIMLAAYNRVGASGGPKEWPPTLPS